MIVHYLMRSMPTMNVTQVQFFLSHLYLFTRFINPL
jgi:hypothetical protein